MKSMLERSLKLFLLPGKPPPDFSHQRLHDNAFRFWRETWTKTFREMGAPDPNPDHFLRQDIIAVLAKGEEVAGVHLYTFFDLTLQSHREHSYFTHHCSPKVLEALSARGVRYVMSLEYLAVHPDWRSSLTGVSLSAVLVENGVRLAFSLGADAVLGVARVDRGIDRVATDIGAHVLDTKPTLYNEEFAVVGFFPNETHPYPKENEHRLADKLWADRVDEAALSPKKPQKKAA